MKPSIDFYKNLPALNHFSDIAHVEHFQRVPDDWVVAMTDVVNSTAAIAAGKHKEVNIAGILGIVAQGNLYKDLEFPFAFGGDGAVFLFPETLLPQIRDILANTRQTCHDLFGLNLRVAFVAARDIYAAGHELSMAKLQVSPRYMQAVLMGSGFDHAERLMKTDGLSAAYLLPSDYRPDNSISYAGLFCPFQNIQSSKEETISLIIKLAAGDTAQQQKTLNAILHQMQTLLGSEQSYHPLADDVITRLATSAQIHQAATIHAQRRGGLTFRGIWLLHQSFRLITLAVNKLGPKNNLVHDADVRKFDGSLKMVIACSQAQRRALQAALDSLRESGEIFYGLHISNKAIVTCLMEFSTMKGVHFVDGADGGYAFAARDLKQQIAART
jgi:hypothetical protein